MISKRRTDDPRFVNDPCPKAEMGVKAFQILNELMAGRTDVSAENVLPTKLMIRRPVNKGDMLSINLK